MFQAIVCDIQGVLVKNGVVNKNLTDFLLTEKEKFNKLILFSNLNTDSINALIPSMREFFGAVDRIYAYEDVKYPKPNVLGFKQVLVESGLQPNEVLFIDDSKFNTDAAKSIGIKTILYENFEDISTLKPLLFP